MKRLQFTRRQKEGGYSAAYIAVFLVALVLFNVIINALATRYEWYFYTGERYEHTAGGAAEAVFAGVSEPVTILFCDEEENLLTDKISSLAYNTALQLSEKLDFLTVETVNIYLHPSKVKPYRTSTDENGVTTEVPITTDSIIFKSAKGHSVETLSTFFVLNDQEVITSYIGEERMISSIGRVLREETVKAAYTATHGENFAELPAFYTLLHGAGYDITTVDLNEDIPADISLIVIANPLYDFNRAAEGSGAVSELDRLEAFVKRGGSLLVSLDPYGKGDLSKLRAFLSECGLSATDEIIKDRENSITSDEFTLITDFADNASAASIKNRIGSFLDGNPITRESSRIWLSSAEGYTAEAILTSSPTARLYRGGETVDDGGSYAVLARSCYTGNEEGGCVILSSGAYFTANDVLNSSTYLNRAVVFALLHEAGAPTVPLGTTALTINSSLLEGLTMQTARLYTVLLVVLLPLALSAVGVIVLARRKFR